MRRNPKQLALALPRRMAPARRVAGPRSKPLDAASARAAAVPGVPLLVSCDPGPERSAMALLALGPHRRVCVLEAVMIDSAWKSVVAYLSSAREQGAGRFALEVPEGFVYAAYRAPGLLRTAVVAGLFEGAAHVAGLPLHPMPAAAWRIGLTGKNNASAARISRALAAFVHGGVAGNEHTRDAIGLGVVVGRDFWSASCPQRSPSASP